MPKILIWRNNRLKDKPEITRGTHVTTNRTRALNVPKIPALQSIEREANSIQEIKEPLNLYVLKKIGALLETEFDFIG